ncbi:MAG: sigma-70 family RNA polymerase sigma factor [Planctomycetes bacterium]|nr:sigma-70 family RNA polymerase sigma factor [Planctomycetota bacterium]
MRPPEGAEADETEWLARARLGDREAFGRLVRRHADRVYRLAHYLTSSRDDAADVAQEAFLRAYRAIGRFEGRSGFATWVLRITTNCALSLRARRRTKKRGMAVVSLSGSEEDAEPIQVADPRADPEAAFRREELGAAVKAAVESLDEEFRSAIVLREIDGRSYEEIAEILGVPLGTVKSKIHRARCALREKLKRFL